MATFRDLCQVPRPLILDGATGTELARRGVAIGGPAWTAGAILNHPDVLREIHRDYVAAGADIITANTFRTHARNLTTLGWEERAEEITAIAVDIAREAAQGRAYVAGSQAPLGDCYSPEETPAGSLLDEHRRHASHLADAGVDLILIETQVSLAEAVAATVAATETGLPVLVSFFCRGDGRLLSGETLDQALRAVGHYAPYGLLVNCLPAEDVQGVLPVLTGNSHCSRYGVTGAYGNTGRMSADGSWTDTGAVQPAVYAEQVRGWVAGGLRIVGGCCGTTPAHICKVTETVYGDL